MTDILYNLFIYPIELIVELIFSVMNNIFQNPGIAIVFVSITVQLLVLPLYKRSDAMQERERDKQRSMSKWTDHIKKTFKGDERYMMLSAYYKQQNYSPLQAINGSFSLLLQIPFFIAAYHFLSNLTVLQGTSFLIINDLSLQDGLIKLGTLKINLLPILMTAINIASGFIYTKDFPLKDKIQLYVVALVFLVILYSSPSGLVLYWTLNNLFSLIKNIFMKVIKNKRRAINIAAAAAVTVLFAVMLFTGRFTSTKRLAFFALLLIAGYIPALMSLLKKGKSDIALKKINFKPNGLEKPVWYVLGVVFLTVLNGAMIPLSVISSSPLEFIGSTYSPLWIFVNTLSVYAGFFLVWFSIFYYLFSDTGRSIFTIIIWVVSGVSLLNFLLLTKDLGEMSASLVFDEIPAFGRGEQLLNLAIVFVLAGALTFVILKFKNAVKYAYIIGIISIIALTAVNCISVKKELNEAGYPEAFETADEYEPILKLSKTEKNVVVIMLDRLMGGYIPYLVDERPDISEMYSGFTFYPNTISFGRKTNFGSPALFGGYEYTPAEMDKRDTESLVSKQNEALKVMPKLFGDNGFDVTVCDPPYAGYQWVSDLRIYQGMEGVKAYHTEGKYMKEADKVYAPYYESIQLRNFVCYSLFETVPTLFKNIVYNEGKYYSSSEMASIKKAFLQSYTVLTGMDKITDITDNGKGGFVMLQNASAHEANYLAVPAYEPSPIISMPIYTGLDAHRTHDGKELQLEEEWHVQQYQVTMCAILKLGRWMQYLRDEGIYDNTRIIITSDHGENIRQISGGTLFDNLIDRYAFNPVMLIKDYDSDGPLKTSDEFMTNADTPSLALAGIIDNPVNPYTGKKISSDIKNEGPLLVNTSPNWDTDENNGNTFDYGDGGNWLSVEKNIFDDANWKFIGKELQ